MKINFNKEGQFFLTTGKEFVPPVYGYSNTALSLDGDYEVQLNDNLVMPTADFIKFNKKEENGDEFTLDYSVIGKDSTVKMHCKKTGNCIKQFSSFTNNGKEDRVLTQLASAQISGICYDEKGIKERLSDGSIKIYYCINRWQGEGQWRCVTPEDLGILSASCHIWEKNVFRMESLSSYCTNEFYPLVFIEDKEKNECFFLEKEGAESWFMEIFCCEGDDVKFLTVKVGGADERLGLNKTLKCGESFNTLPCVFGVVKGGIDEAVRELTLYKRRENLNTTYCPLVFNDFMNCNWALPSDEKLIPLIDRASEIGVEIFCIDDGWAEQGVWKPLDNLFGKYKFKGIIDYIISKGMKPGVWFEFERASEKTAEELGDDNYFMRRYGKYLANNRKKVNLSCEKARAYILERIASLYDMGIRYIKNDHNNNEGIGFDGFDCYADSVISQTKAFYSLVDEIREKFPDLILENCGGGAMRSDFGTLKRFSVQSVSDQEDYLLNPSITGGSLAYIIPEKAGLWCYPCPLLFKNMQKVSIPEDELNGVSSERQTAFNMINGMVGTVYLSGKINQLKGKSLDLVKEGVKLYKDNREFIRKSFAVFPKGFIRLSNKEDYAIGLVSEDYGEMLLAVWNLSPDKRKVTVDISKYGFGKCSVLYYGDGKTVKLKDGKVIAKFNCGKDAVLLKLEK